MGQAQDLSSLGELLSGVHLGNGVALHASQGRLLLKVTVRPKQWP